MSPTFESATDRLGRLLTMVPWLLHRQGIDIAEASAQLGVGEEQIVEDLQLLFVCGTPGHLPDDLIEASWEGGRVHLGNADPIARPLRLGRDEALALIVALRALAAVPGIDEHDAIDRALAKLEAAAGEAGRDLAQVSVAIDTDEQEQQLLRQVHDALARHRRLHLRYVVASRDEATERDVDPMRVLSVDGRWYLEAWCHRAKDVRMFRLDRVEVMQVLDVDGTPPEQAHPRTVTAKVFQPSADDLTVQLELTPGASWVAENFPVEAVERRKDGSVLVSMRTADPNWLRRLVWRLGGQARVVAPASLIEGVTAGAREATRMNRV
ncbi:MAG: WYL domain-containing protein [Actinomycetota bacterium]|nr:WYL domain-containing protein [Actinomycetota bacterium]